jgi:hypothetical protein
LVCHSKDRFETKPLFSSGVLIKCLGAFTSATDCQHVRQGEAVFVEVDNELCLGDGKTNGGCITTSKVAGIIRILEELIEEPKRVVIELVGDPKSDNEKGASQPKDLPTFW